MVKMITLTRQVSPAARPAVLGSAELARVSGGSTEADTELLKSRHDTIKNAIGN